MEGIIVRGWRWNHHRPGNHEGQAERKKVLILHGFESTVVNFDKYINPLIQKNYEVLAFDAPAHGRSGGRQINAPLYKRTILGINKLYGPVQSFMAHSFGGLAVCLALEELSHGTPAHLSHSYGDYRLVLLAPATETTTAIDAFFTFLKLDPSVRTEFDKVIVQKGGVGPGWYSIRRAVNNIRAKILWIHDEDDDTTPVSDVLKVKSDNHPHIEFVITKGLGHRRIYRDSKVVKMVTDFL